VGIASFLIIMGVSLMMSRCRTAIGWPLWLLGAALFASTILSILAPLGHFLPPPEWVHLIDSIHFPILPNVASATPVESMYWCGVLSLTVLFALNLLARPLDSDELTRFATLAVAGCSLYCLLALSSWRTGWEYPFFTKNPDYPEVFGFFPNRNHTAGFLLSGAILAAGLVFQGLLKSRLLLTWFGLVSFALLAFPLLFLSHSRAGLIFLFVGLMIWLVGLGRYRSRLLIVIFTACSLLLLGLFLKSDSPLLSRLTGRHLSGAGGSAPADCSEMRLPIAKDTLRMILGQPVTGCGLGSYRLLYPLYAKESLRYQTRALHPESDWLMVAAETGVPSLVLALLCLAVLLLRVPRLTDSAGEDWPLKWAFLSAFLAEVLHGLVDVPLHRIELGWWVMMLGGVGFAWRGPSITRAPLIQRLFFMIGGAGAILLGLWMLSAQTGRVRALPPFESDDAQSKVLGMYAVVDSSQVGPVFSECERLLSLYPLNTELIHQYAIFLIQEKVGAGKSADLFDAERRLLPDDASVPFQQGWVLMDADPEQAVTLWKEALRRQSVMDGRPDGGIPRTSDLFRSMQEVASEHPAMIARIREVAATAPQARLVYLQNPGCDRSEIREALADPVFLAALPLPERGRLLERLWELGDREELFTLISTHPELTEAAVPVNARRLGAEGKAEEACRLLDRTYGIGIPQQRDAANVIRGGDSNVPSDPLEAARYYIDLGNDVAAERLLSECMNGEQRKEALRLRADMEMRAGRWDLALPDLLLFLRETGRI
jgi:O-antigen ligase